MVAQKLKKKTCHLYRFTKSENIVEFFFWGGG